MNSAKNPRKYMLIKIITTGAILAMLLPGCAFNDLHLDMPISGLAKPNTEGNGREVIIAIPFKDLRPHKERCGMKKNAHNQDTADVICDVAPGKWASQLLADELRASHFKVLTPETPHRESALRIDGAIQQFFTEPVMQTRRRPSSLETDIQIRLIATTENGLHAERTFFVKGMIKNITFSTRGAYHTSLKRAADEILAEMVEAIFSLMEEYPQISAPDFQLQAIKPYALEDNQ